MKLLQEHPGSRLEEARCSNCFVLQHRPSACSFASCCAVDTGNRGRRHCFAVQPNALNERSLYELVMTNSAGPRTVTSRG